jgi:hypothetical protein
MKMQNFNKKYEAHPAEFDAAALSASNLNTPPTTIPTTQSTLELAVRLHAEVA